MAAEHAKWWNDFLVDADLRALDDNVTIEPDPLPSAEGLIYVPDIANGKQALWRGTVVSAGPGRRGKGGKRVPHDVKEGMRVWYDRTSCTPVGPNLTMVRSEAVELEILEGDEHWEA